MKQQSWASFRKYLAEKCQAKGVPSTVTFELTARCNLKCRMCYVREDSPKVTAQEKSAQQWVALAKQAQQLGVLEVFFTGGEVFLRADFREIYEGVYSLGMIPEILSNATLIGRKETAWLKEHPPNRVNVTLYGGSSGTYGALCNNPDGFDKATQGIDRLLDSGINVELRTTVVPENVKDYNAILKFADERDLKLLVITYISPPRNAPAELNNVSRLPPEEIVRYLDQYSKDRGVRWGDQETLHSKEQHDKNRINHHYPFECLAGRDAPWISWDGRMMPCGLMGDPATLPFFDGFQSAWKQLMRKVKTVPVCIDCLKCKLREYCNSCPARLKRETGSSGQKSPYLCELATETKKLYVSKQRHLY